MPGNGPVVHADASWVVAIADRPTDGDPPRKHCVGTLIAPRIVITSGHCLTGRAPGDVTVIAGRTDLRTRDGAEIPARDLWLTPGNFPDGENFFAGIGAPKHAPPDIGLVLLAAPLAGPPLPIVDADHSHPTAGSLAHYYGWRASPSDEPVLWQSPLTVLADDRCAQHAREARSGIPPVFHGFTYNPSEYLCVAGSTTPGPGSPNPPFRGTDSGAPVVANGQLVGVHGWRPDPDPAMPAFPARVGTYSHTIIELVDAVEILDRFP